MRAYMTEPSLLESLEGQQYLVMRPVAAVADFDDAEQRSLRRRVPQAQHPNAGHVTLRGFFEPHRLDELRAFLRSWATSQSPIDVRVEAVDGFPPPFQILICRLQRASSLVDAYAGLTALLDTTDFERIGELPLDRWTFHLSLLYCGALSEPHWESALAGSSRIVRPAPSETLSAVDFVWYRGGIEHVETFALRRSEPEGQPARTDCRGGRRGNATAATHALAR